MTWPESHTQQRLIIALHCFIFGQCIVDDQLLAKRVTHRNYTANIYSICGSRI